MSQSAASNNSRKRTRTEAQLERKRLRDRESQRVCRERNKERLTNIEIELAELRSRYESLLAFTDQLKQNHTLASFCSSTSPRSHSHSVGTTSHSLSPLAGPHTDGASPSTPFFAHSEVAESPAASFTHSLPVGSDRSTLSNASCNYSSCTSLTTAVSNGSNVAHWDDSMHELLNGAGLYQSFAQPDASAQEPPDDQNNMESASSPSTQPIYIASSPSTVCLCGHIHAKRPELECQEHKVFQLLFNAHTALASNPKAAEPFPRTPSLSNLLLIDIDTNPVIEAIGEMMQRSSPLQLADSIAVVFVIYRLLRWRVLPIPETYYDIPEWYRPSVLQRSRPHSICMDMIAWPELRDFLIANPDRVDTIALGRDISDCLTVEWPDNEQLVVRDIRTNETVLNPKFEEHIWDFSNWKMRRRWSWRQPRLVALVNLSEKN